LQPEKNDLENHESPGLFFILKKALPETLQFFKSTSFEGPRLRVICQGPSGRIDDTA
jgi:hypothetical protein